MSKSAHRVKSQASVDIEAPMVPWVRVQEFKSQESGSETTSVKRVMNGDSRHNIKLEKQRNCGAFLVLEWS